RKCVETAAVADGGPIALRLRVRRNDGHPGHHSALRVLDRPGDRAPVELRESRRCTQQNERGKCHTPPTPGRSIECPKTTHSPPSLHHPPHLSGLGSSTGRTLHPLGINAN